MLTRPPSPPRRAGRLLLLLLLPAVPASLALALISGSLDAGWPILLTLATGGDAGLPGQVVLELRLPRALAAFATGGLLALAGTLMQVLLRNPLADPYVLGVSGGAAVAALGAMIAGMAAAWLPLAGFAGALLSTFLVFGLARGEGSWTGTRLLLTGVVVAAGWGALISLLLSLGPAAQLRGMLFWLMGDLAHAGHAGLGFAVLGLGLVLTLPLARQLNLLARGDLQAGALGVAVQPLRLRLYVLASLLTAGAVALAGSVGFVGLVVPHLLRLLGATDHRVLMPAAVLLGGILLTLADTLARTAIAPQQLPVGVVTALVGVPVFLYLLRRESRR
ncbi:MAG: iron ABC transporter permease [Gammaproteobacteria bacterium]|nr:iron ABC transporter permease [Gammaproteobacteria bacterium]